jgi:hypothetical protein
MADAVRPSTRTVLITGLAGSALLAALSTVQAVGLRVVRDLAPEVPQTFALQLVPWLAWALFLPAIYQLCARWPVHDDRWRRLWWRYALLALAAPAVHTLAVFAPIAWIRGWFALGYPLQNSYGFVYVNGAVGAILQFALIVAGCQAVLAVRSAGERRLAASTLSTRLVEAELRALRAQLEPHFLFNTLNTITAHVRDEPALAEEMLERLSALLRLVLQGSATHEVPLQQELELVRHYLGIHEVRHAGRLTTAYRIDGHAEHALVPSMLLQPLVENAVAHGVSAHAGPGHIAISADVTGAMLVVGVWNSGLARTADDGGGGRSGLGLANSRSRLAQLYGAQQSLVMRSVDGGTLVEVRVPLRWATGATRPAMPAGAVTRPVMQARA